MSHFTCGGICPPKENNCLELIRAINEEMKKKDVIVVQVAGGSASGKTTIANEINSFYRDCSIVISQDNYYNDFYENEKRGVLPDQPEAVDLVQLQRDVFSLRNGEQINQPIYSFKEEGGKRVGWTKVLPKKIIIVEGLFVLNEILDSCDGIKVFIKTLCHGRFIRRIARDITRTSWSPKETLGYFLKVVDPLHKKYIDIQESRADIVIINQYDPLKEPSSFGCLKENQCKVMVLEELDVKKLYSLGVERLSSSFQQDTYFSIPGKEKDELLRIRREGKYILFTYKSPYEKDSKYKVEFPISCTEEEIINNQCKEEIKIAKERTLFVLDGIFFSEDKILVSEQENKIFLEFRMNDSKKIRETLKRLGIENYKIIKDSYFNLFFLF